MQNDPHQAFRWAGVVLLASGATECVSAATASALCTEASRVIGATVLYLARADGEPFDDPALTGIPLPTESLPSWAE